MGLAFVKQYVGVNLQKGSQVRGSFDERHRFDAWPNREIPAVAAGVYAIWRDNGELVYVGMSGRGIETADPGKGKYGLVKRLQSHASGRLSGDQFCVYVANRLVVPMLVPAQLTLFASGELRLDALTRSYIREHFSYSYVLVDTSSEAYALELRARSGKTFGVKPLLNPK